MIDYITHCFENGPSYNIVRQLTPFNEGLKNTSHFCVCVFHFDAEGRKYILSKISDNNLLMSEFKLKRGYLFFFLFFFF